MTSMVGRSQTSKNCMSQKAQNPDFSFGGESVNHMIFTTHSALSGLDSHKSTFIKPEFQLEEGKGKSAEYAQSMSPKRDEALSHIEKPKPSNLGKYAKALISKSHKGMEDMEHFEHHDTGEEESLKKYYAKVSDAPHPMTHELM